ncbi:hypothetical protein BGX38DRAFT_1276397 [Terfezia claveryi]|nr:hypothetical protein BGX38DRAFT_1276397 [Terfezia claveryi]
MLADNAEGGDISGRKRKRISRPAELPTLEGKQSAEGSSGMRLSSLCSILGVSGLAERFCEYLRMNMDSSRGTLDTEKIGNYRSYYYNTLAIPVPQFQGDRESIHRVRWTGKEGFRGWDKASADWLEGLFNVHDETWKVYEVALVVLLHLRGPAKPSGEEGMIWVELREEWKRTHMIQIADIEGMAHLIPLETGKTWLVNNRIDLNTWNKLYA